jgi:WD40 repeat protein
MLDEYSNQRWSRSRGSELFLDRQVGKSIEFLFKESAILRKVARFLIQGNRRFSNFLKSRFLIHTHRSDGRSANLKFAMAAVPVPLNSSGKIFDKNYKPESSRGGLVCSLKNHLIRGTVWNLYSFTFHHQTGSMCLADERGQVYYLNFHENMYESLRLASYPILSLEFIHSRPSNLLVGYANGFTVCIDTITHEISSTLSPRGSEPICLIKCSPSKPLAVLLSISGKLTLWDISQMTILRRMEIPEPVVDVYFLSGSQISVIFETLGAVIYSLSDSMNVIGRCTTPAR